MRSLLDFFDRSLDLLENRIQVGCDLAVPKTKNSDATDGKLFGSYLVIF